MKCIYCSNEAVKGKKKCLNCLETGQVSSYTRYHRLKRAGICVGCGKNKTDGKVYCFKCLQKKYELKNKREKVLINEK